MPALLGVYLDAGRAAMIGFFMAYFVDSLTGVGLVDQMGNFFCKTLLFVAVAGVLFIRKNEDLDKLKDLFDAWKELDSSTVSEVSNFSFTLAAQDCEAALCLDPNHTETLHLYSRSKDQASSIDNTIFGLD